MNTSFQKLFFIALLMFFPFAVSAQYTTPGTNLTLTFSDLVDMSGGVVVQDGDVFIVNDDIVVSESDKLEILEETYIKVAAGKRIEVLGQFISDPIFGKVTFTAVDTLSAGNNFRGFRFDNAEPSLFRNTIVKYGGGIQLLGTFAEFDHCVIRNNGTSNVSNAISYSNASPVITHCDFIQNLQSAIGSAANTQGSPLIQHNRFIHNVTNNSNRPQINLGPGVPGDTLRIENNYIEGAYSMSGGIAMATLTGGSIVASIRNNTIINNRYGYTQVGNNISTVIEGNHFIDNNLEVNPMNGGSGINFFGSNTTNVSVVRNNLITGNLWGITIQGNAQPSFGTFMSPGGNVIFDNGNSGTTYALYNNTPQPINAVGNYWGDNSTEFAESVIFHQPDDPSLGPVTYMPIKNLHPDFLTFGFLAGDNPSLNEDIWGEVDVENAIVTINLPSGASIQSLVPFADIDLGASVIPELGQAYDFSNPFVFAISVPHSDDPRAWTVMATQSAPDAGIQFVHQAADPALEVVDVYFNGELHLESFGFRDATPFDGIEEGSELLVEIKAPGTDEVLFTESFSGLEQGTLVFHGLIEPGNFLPNPDDIDTGLALTYFEYIVPLVEGPILNLFHAATDLQTVQLIDVTVYNGFPPRSYAETPSDYINFEPFIDTFYLEMRDAANGDVLFVHQLNINDIPTGSFVLFISGFLKPAENQNGEALCVFAVSFDGDVIELPNVTSSGPNPELPVAFDLRQNYPNPFNPTTTISFDLPEHSDVRLSVYNTMGQLVAVLVNEARPAGYHSVNFDASALSSGMYVYRLQAGGFTLSRKMILVK